MTPSRRVLRRSRTRPAPSRPTMLQLFLPKSTPRMRTSFMPPSYRHPVMVEERGGPFHKGGGSIDLALADIEPLFRNRSALLLPILADGPCRVAVVDSGTLG